MWTERYVEWKSGSRKYDRYLLNRFLSCMVSAWPSLIVLSVSIGSGVWHEGQNCYRWQMTGRLAFVPPRRDAPIVVIKWQPDRTRHLIGCFRRAAPCRRSGRLNMFHPHASLFTRKSSLPSAISEVYVLKGTEMWSSPLLLDTLNPLL